MKSFNSFVLPYLEFNGCCFCGKNQFLCNNRKCIPESWKCNGVNNCGDNSDEIGVLCKGSYYVLFLDGTCILHLNTSTQQSFTSCKIKYRLHFRHD